MKKKWYLIGQGAVLILWCICFYNGKIMMEQYNTVSARFFECNVEQQTLERIIRDSREQDKDEEVLPLLAAYKRASFTSIGLPDAKNSILAAGTEVFGDMSLVMPFHFIDGNVTGSGDYKGCILSQKAAYQLFGSGNAVGLEVVYQDKSYIVRGVFESKEAMIFVRNQEKSAVYDCVELRFRNMENAGYCGDEFLQKNGITGTRVIIDSELLENILKIFYLLTPCLIIAFISADTVTLTGRFSSRASRGAVGAAAMILFVIILISLFQFDLQLSESLIPTKWSDFDFYVNTGKNIAEGFKNLNQMTPQIKERQMQQQALTCIFTGLSSLGILVLCRKMRDYTKSPIKM